MNLYEVTISGTQQQVQASKPEFALNEALSNLKYGDSGTRLSSVLKDQHSIHLEIDIKNLGKTSTNGLICRKCRRALGDLAQCPHPHN